MKLLLSVVLLCSIIYEGSCSIRCIRCVEITDSGDYRYRTYFDHQYGTPCHKQGLLSRRSDWTTCPSEVGYKCGTITANAEFTYTETERNMRHRRDVDSDSDVIYDSWDKVEQKSTPGLSTYRYQCKDGSHIARELVCNYVHDCSDGSDELNCTEHTRCSSQYLRCNSGKCVSRRNVCDIHKHCNDNTETSEFCRSWSSEKTKSTPTYLYQCKDGSHIHRELVCNYIPDCSDGSDQLNCTHSSYPCNSWELRCNNGRCIYRGLVCDGYKSCGDNTESSQFCRKWFSEKTTRAPITTTTQSTPVFSTYLYQCKDGSHIDRELVCNYRHDCSDGSDELNCTSHSPCSSPYLRCNSGRCIVRWNVCDRHKHCNDNTETSQFCRSWSSEKTKTTTTTTQAPKRRSFMIDVTYRGCVPVQQATCNMSSEMREDAKRMLMYKVKYHSQDRIKHSFQLQRVNECSYCSTSYCDPQCGDYSYIVNDTCIPLWSVGVMFGGLLTLLFIGITCCCCCCTCCKTCRKRGCSCCKKRQVTVDRGRAPNHLFTVDPYAYQRLRTENQPDTQPETRRETQAGAPIYGIENPISNIMSPPKYVDKPPTETSSEVQGAGSALI